ncbi:MAG: right-handed parallel beta-helix repeat-containing protein [Chloroflexi bacterium]|nr:right-handed parallel beta-helix repeat-containing protein [Chloroflexota bacterium]MDA1272176.1 right-handed parallel beta-helix repeat-containing protein [Chloroflexota bacterium]PKB59267.1 MAG: hypothetical protein BZY83_02730 [SAR202 cluster bacterium Casp-Chloro-G2]
MNWKPAQIHLSNNLRATALGLITLMLAGALAWVVFNSSLANAGARAQDNPAADINPRPQSIEDSSGTYTTIITVSSDPAGHAEFIGMPSSLGLNVTVSSGSIVLNGTPPTSWVNVSGGISGDGSFTATGTGTVAGTPDVTVVMSGTIDSSGALTATYVMGAAGELSGQSITYGVSLTIPSASPEPTATPVPTPTPSPVPTPITGATPGPTATPPPVSSDPKVHSVTVTVDGDDGVCDENCTLREALNASGPGHTIKFAIPGPGPHSVILNEPLYFSLVDLAPIAGTTGNPLVDTLLIDGFSQAGSKANTNPANLASNAVRNILIKAVTPGITSAMSLSPDWITLIKGLAFEGFENAVALNDSGVTLLDGLKLDQTSISGTAKANLSLLNGELASVRVNVDATAEAGKNITLIMNGNIGEDVKFNLDTDGKGEVDINLVDNIFTLGKDYSGTTVDLTLKTGGAINVNNLNVTNLDFAEAAADVGIDIKAGTTLLGEPITLNANISGSTLIGLNRGITATATANVVGNWGTRGSFISGGGFGASWMLDGDVSFDSDNNTIQDNSQGGLLVNYNTNLGENIKIALNGDALLRNGLFNGKFEASGSGSVTWDFANVDLSGGIGDGAVFTGGVNARYDVTMDGSRVRDNFGLGLSFGASNASGDKSFTVDIDGTDIGGNDQGIEVSTGFKLHFSENANTVHDNRQGLVLNGADATIDGDVFTNNDVGIWVKNKGTATISGNTVTKNKTAGILVDNGTATIENNSDISGNGDGVLVQNGGFAAVKGNTVTGNTGAGIRVTGNATAEITGNTASDNMGAGIAVESPVGTVISGNTISGNGGLGVDIGAQGRAANDPGDADTVQNYPEVASAEIDSAGDLIIEYKVDSDPGNSAYPLKIEFFAAGSAREGQTALGTVLFTEDDFASGTGIANLSNAAALGLAAGGSITALAIANDGNTSEMSDAAPVGSTAPSLIESTPVPTPKPTPIQATAVPSTAAPAPAATMTPVATAIPMGATTVPTAAPQPAPTPTPTMEAQATAAPVGNGGSCSRPGRDGGKVELSLVAMLAGLLGLVVVRRRN